jgi:hypothetical protein
MTGGAVGLVPSRLFTLSHKTLTQASRFTGLPLHFLVVGFIATPFFAAYHPGIPGFGHPIPRTPTYLPQRWTTTFSNTSDTRYRPTTEIDCA